MSLSAVSQLRGRSGRSFILALVIGVLILSLSYRLIRDGVHFKSGVGFLGLPQSDRKYSNPLEGIEEYDNSSVAIELAKKVRVLCWVLTQPNSDKKIISIQATWGMRCNIILFMSSFADKSPITVKLRVPEGRDFLWGKTKAAFRYVYEHHRNDADWFLKTDDDTYVIVENLRYMLAEHDYNKLIYFGFRFKPFTKQGYMSGGAGYVLSRAALDKFMEKAQTSSRHCKTDETGAEDVEMGICLHKIGVKAMDSRDSTKRGRFFPFRPEDYLRIRSKETVWWYTVNRYYPEDQGPNCCSEHAITFHYITPENMFLLDYLIYQLRPYGINYRIRKIHLATTETNIILLGNSTQARVLTHNT